MRAFDEQTVFRSLFAAYPDALLVAESNGTIVLANPRAADLLGYEVEGLVGLSVDALVPDSIRPRHAAYRETNRSHPGCACCSSKTMRTSVRWSRTSSTRCAAT